MDKNVEKMQVRQGYRNLWHTDLISTIRADTPCMNTICSHVKFLFLSNYCCSVWLLRKNARKGGKKIGYEQWKLIQFDCLDSFEFLFSSWIIIISFIFGLCLVTENIIMLFFIRLVQIFYY